MRKSGRSIKERKVGVVSAFGKVSLGYGGEDMDLPAVDELRLFIENDADLYRQQMTPIIENIKKKLARGVYDHSLAPKLWGYLVESGAKKYVKEVGGGSLRWNEMFPPSVRRKVAQELADDYLEMIQNEEFGPVGKKEGKVVISQVDSRARSRVEDYVSAMREIPSVEVREMSKAGAVEPVFGVYGNRGLVVTASFDVEGNPTLVKEAGTQIEMVPAGPNAARSWIQQILRGC